MLPVAAEEGVPDDDTEAVRDALCEADAVREAVLVARRDLVALQMGEGRGGK